MSSHPSSLEKPAARIDEPPDAESFDQLGLSERVLAGVRAAGFERPTPIQARFIPKALNGHDVMGQAKTGTGKTAAFLLPIFERIRPGKGGPTALVLAPTRELALQIHGEVERLGGEPRLATAILYGGSSYEPQNKALAAGVDLVVGTPGRVMDHMRSRRLHLDNVQVAVLDEADRMLDLGFRKDIEFILRHCPTKRQTLLLSATFPEDIQKLAKRFMHEPVEVWTAAEHITVDEVEQFYCVTERENKLPLLLKVLDEERPSLAIIFCTTKFGAKKLAARLKAVGLNAREIHGDLVQSKREKIMGRFRTGKVQMLVATDVASRGIDVLEISHIINYDIPFRAEDYVHRIGRTGRIGRSGKAFTLVTREESVLLTEIEQLINREIHLVKFNSLESRFWPKPPAVLPPEFAPPDEESATGEDDYVSKEKQDSKHGGRRHRGRGDGRSGAPRHESAASAGRPRRRGGPARGGEGVSTEVVCSKCGAQTTVRFKPDPGRPVYCDSCFEKVKAHRRGGTPRAPLAAPEGG